MFTLEFEDPPDRSAKRYNNRTNADRHRIVAALAEYPDRWAVVSRHLSRNRAAQVARVLRDRYSDKGYEFRPAERDGQGVVYGRYDPANVKLD